MFAPFQYYMDFNLKQYKIIYTDLNINATPFVPLKKSSDSQKGFDGQPNYIDEFKWLS